MFNAQYSKNAPKILLIKTGAAGDVVRTTVLLNALSGRITWVIDARYQPVLPDHHPHLERVIPLENAPLALQNETFDLTISLEEDKTCALLASSVKTRKLTGIYTEGNTISYTKDAAGWFDMSLLSKQGFEAANAAKLRNTETFQHWLLAMIQQSFNGQPYCIYRNNNIRTEPRLVGIEKRAGARWPNKSWSGYAALISRLEAEGYRCLVLSQKDHIRDYLDDIARCAFLISGDTLAMHVAMAYHIPCIAIFNCTSPTEIYDYGLLTKVVNPLLHQAFYSRDFSQEVVDAVQPATVYEAFKQIDLARNVPFGSR